MRRFLIPIVIVGVLAMALPASASPLVSGDGEMFRHAGFRGEEAACPHISWVGSLEISDSEGMDGTYGITLSKADIIPQTVFEDGWWWWAEYFTVFDGLFEFDEAGSVIECEPGAVMLHGYDSGVGQAGSKFWDTGYLIEAAGPFEGMEGAKVDQLGTFTEWSDDMQTPDGDPFPNAFTIDFIVESIDW